MANVSEVSICNQAMGWLGCNRIIALDDNTREGSLCKANYPILRDAVEEEADWTFAQVRLVLTPMSSAPAWGYAQQFLLPGSVLRVVYVGNSDRWEEDDAVNDWQREGNKLVANETTLYVRAIQRVTDPAQFSSLFSQALAARIAMDLALPLTNSRSMMQSMAELFSAKMRTAVAQDNKQGRARVLRAKTLVNARVSGSNSLFGR